MSSSISERPLGRDRKCFSRKVMRLFYVPFVDVTDARKSVALDVGATSEKTVVLREYQERIENTGL
jgi:hypothetical protein